MCVCAISNHTPEAKSMIDWEKGKKRRRVAASLLLLPLFKTTEGGGTRAADDSSGDRQWLRGGRKTPIQLKLVLISTIWAEFENKPLRRRKLHIHYSIPKDNSSDKDINQGTLVVFNLDPSLSCEDLFQIFRAYGEVKEAFVSEYAVTGNDAGSRSLLGALAELGFLSGVQENRF